MLELTDANPFELIEANPFEFIEANPFNLQSAIPSRVSYQRSWIRIYIFVTSNPDPDSTFRPNLQHFLPTPCTTPVEPPSPSEWTYEYISSKIWNFWIFFLKPLIKLKKKKGDWLECVLSRTVVARADEPVPDETAHPGVGGLVQAHRLLVPHHPNSSSLK